MATKGIKQTEEHKNKRLEAIRELEETKQKNREWHMGRTPWNKGKEFKHKGSFKEGHKFIGGSKGWFTTERMKGEKNPNWEGGISFNPYPKQWTNSLKKSIRERDKHICYICKNKGNHVHHINYNKEDCRPENLITLCSSCHIKTNHNREYWRGFFNGRSV